MRRPIPDLRARSAAPRRGRRIGERLLILAIAFSTFGGLLASAPPPIVQADELDDAYERQKELERLIARQRASIRNLTAGQAVLATKISNTKRSLAEINANLLAVRTQIVAMTVDVARSQNAVDELTATAAALAAEVARIEAEEEKKAAELEARKALLAQRILESYETDRTSMLETFLSGDDFTDVLTEVGYHMDFAEQDLELAKQIQEDQAVLAVLRENVDLARTQTTELQELATESKKVLDAQMRELNAARKELARLEAETQRLLREQQATYARLASNKARAQATLKEQVEAQKQLEALIERLVREALARGGIPSQYNGTFRWPMAGRITQEFGCTGYAWNPPYGNCAHFHRGIDIANVMYTPIYAAGAGKVIFAGRSPYDPAWIVIIAHSEHLVSWYGHIDNRSHPPAVREGQFVAKGQLIAYNGLTGFTTGPHLHWAVQLDGAWVNPRLFLSR